MNAFDKLELSTETIRELSSEEMQKVAGGAKPDLDSLVPTCGCTGMWPTFNGCTDTLAC